MAGCERRRSFIRIAATIAAFAVLWYASFRTVAVSRGAANLIAKAAFLILTCLACIAIGFFLPIVPVISSVLGSAFWAGLLATAGALVGMALSDAILARLETRQSGASAGDARTGKKKCAHRCERGSRVAASGPNRRKGSARDFARRRASLMTRLNIHGLGFTLFLALLTALPPLSIDMALPSLTLIQADLHAPQTEAAAAIAIFIAGFSSAPILVGPLADRFGRKAVMSVGLVLFTLSAAGAALAPSIRALLAFRLMQGASAGAVGILPRAIIRDLFEGREARLQLAAVSLVFSVAPLIAPSLGGAILFFGSWRLIFAVLTGVSVLVTLVALALFQELHAAENRRKSRSPRPFSPGTSGR